jgi:hypothetical protein
MRTRDVVRKLKKSKDLPLHVSFQGTARYTRSCKISIPCKSKWFSWWSNSFIGTDVLLVQLYVGVTVKPDDIEEFMTELNQLQSLENCISKIQEFEWEKWDDAYHEEYGWDGYDNSDQIENWMILEDNPHLSHYLDGDKHTYIPKDGDPDEYDYTYVDNWVERGALKVRLEEFTRFKKWIRRQRELERTLGARMVVYEDQFRFTGFEQDEQYKVEVAIKGIGTISEKQMIRVASAYIGKEE